MDVEIVRKFLVKNDSWRVDAESELRILQGYLANNANGTVRVRVKGDDAFLTLEGSHRGLTRGEYAYPIPVADAESMLRELAVFPPIDRVRHRLRVGGHVWELDRFAGANAGLEMARVVLAAEDDAFEMPDWAGEEVSADPRYDDLNLARKPYRRW